MKPTYGSNVTNLRMDVVATIPAHCVSVSQPQKNYFPRNGPAHVKRHGRTAVARSTELPVEEVSVHKLTEFFLKMKSYSAN